MTIMSNPSNTAYLRMAIVVWAIIAIIGSIFLILDFYVGAIIFTILFSIGFLYYFATWLRECYYRPSDIEIQEGGILMAFRHSSGRYIEWGDILGIYSSKDESAWIANPLGTGKIIPRKGISRFVTFELAERVAQQYRERTGLDILREGTYEDDRNFRRRALNNNK